MSLGDSDTRSPCPGRLGNATTGHTAPCIFQPGPSLTPATALGSVVAGAGAPHGKYRGHWTCCQSRASFCSLKMGKKRAGCGGFSSPVSIKWELQEHHQAQASKMESGLLEEEIMTTRLI